MNTRIGSPRAGELNGVPERSFQSGSQNAADGTDPRLGGKATEARAAVGDRQRDLDCRALDRPGAGVGGKEGQRLHKLDAGHRGVVPVAGA